MWLYAISHQIRILGCWLHRDEISNGSFSEDNMTTLDYTGNGGKTY